MQLATHWHDEENRELLMEVAQFNQNVRVADEAVRLQAEQWL